MTHGCRTLLAFALAVIVATEARAQSETLLSDVTIVDVIEGNARPVPPSA